MIRNTDKRRAGSVPGTAATVAGTFDGCRAWSYLLIMRRSLETESRAEVWKYN
jgi:hypothetical protein